MKKIERIILVGHCGFDTRQLRQAVTEALEKVELTANNHQASLESQAGSDQLLLINRVLDGQFEHASGIDLIRSLRSQPHPPLAMLISDLEDAQAQAVAAGGLPGFGKSQVGSAQVVHQLRQAVGR